MLLTFSSFSERDSRLNLYLSINLRRRKIYDKLILYKTIIEPPTSGITEMPIATSIYRLRCGLVMTSFLHVLRNNG